MIVSVPSFDKVHPYVNNFYFVHSGRCECLCIAADDCSTAYANCTGKYMLHIKCCKTSTLQHLVAAQYSSYTFLADLMRGEEKRRGEGRFGGKFLYISDIKC